MAWVAVDKDGDEYIYRSLPERWPPYWSTDDRMSALLPKGSIKRLIGRELTWYNEPVELTESIVNLPISRIKRFIRWKFIR